MTYKIIGDSCLDLTEELKKDPGFQMIPLTLQVGNVQVIDDETFDQSAFIEMVKACPECPKTACPSPESFKKAYEEADADAVFVITLSNHLSGSYNSAVLAKELYEEEKKEAGEPVTKKIAVIDSLSASSGELDQALYIRDLCEQGLDFETVAEMAEAYSHRMKTYFVLETLDTLRKNGRLSGLQAFFATALNIKPVMGAEEGVIIKLDQARGINRALAKMVDYVVENVEDPETKVLGITHCNCPARGEMVKNAILERIKVKDVILLDTAGVSSLYASDGGIIVVI